MKKQINMSLSSSSIDKAIKEVINYKQELLGKMQLLIETLVNEGVEIAKNNVSAMVGEFATGELEASIKGAYFPARGEGYIVAESDHAMYFEFGIGLVGKENPHPNAQGWQYDVNNHGENGWWYFDKGEWRWTKGYKYHPFMYNTAIELLGMVEGIAKGIFNE